MNRVLALGAVGIAVIVAALVLNRFVNNDDESAPATLAA